MKPGQFKMIEDLFARAVACEPDQREALVREGSGGDVVVVEHVRSLLDAHGAAGRFLEKPAAGRAGDALLADDGGAMSGRRFGAYEAVEPIGTGGMGVVYLGRRSDAQYEKRVAIKFVHRWVGSSEGMERFERECRLLAPLQHPNIAMLLDAGVSPDGTPYIVMEHVDGRAIDAHCQEEALSIDERLRLFLDVCDAVHAAHGALVAHLDIKPSNILVTRDGLVKLVDFGVAQLLDARGSAGAPSAFTPAYAAPEQIARGTLTAATDVYALGAVLYRLLANVRPFSASGDAPGTIEQTVLATPPTPPSGAAQATGAADDARTVARLRRRLAGDLDMIVLKAMHKEPGARYASPAEFADDIRRHLAGQTVRAVPDSARYRASRFVKRHRVGVAAAALLALALVGGLSGVAWQARAAVMQRDRAEARFADLRRLTNTLVESVDRRLADLPGSVDARRELISESAAYLDSLAGEVDDEPELLLEVADSYQQLADLQRNLISSDLGFTERSVENHEKARAMRERALLLRPGDAEALAGLATSAIRLGDMRRLQGKLDEAIDEYRAGDALWERAGVGGGISELDAMHNRAVGLTKIGITESMRGNLDEAELAYDTAHSINNAIIDRDPSRLVDLRNSAVTLEKRGDIREHRGDASGALALYREAHDVYARLAELEPNDARHRFSVAVSHSKLGEVLGTPSYSNLGDVEGALREYERGREIIASLVVADPEDARARGAAAFFDRRLGTLYGLAGRFDEALELQLAAHATAERSVSDNPGDLRALSDVASTCMTIAATHESMRRMDGAVHWRRRAVETQRAILAISPELARVRTELGVALRALGDALMSVSAGAGEDAPAVLREAHESLVESVRVFEDLLARGNERASLSEDLAAARESLARCVAVLPASEQGAVPDTR